MPPLWGEVVRVTNIRNVIRPQAFNLAHYQGDGMMESTQRSFSWHSPTVNAPKSVVSFIEESLKTLIFLTSPADTTDTLGKKELQLSRSNGITLKGSTKALFWIAVSITMAILIGQLS